jgi:probable F420-dependent oxidoreductase
MRFGLAIGNVTPAGEAVDACLAAAKQAESAGFHSVWVQDHVAMTEGMDATAARPPWLGGLALSPDAECFEPLVLVSALAMITDRVQIGTAVLGAPYRHPAIVAKMLAAADLLSGGRVVLGAGTGWSRDAFDALGLQPEHYDRRAEVTGEYVRAIKEMWLNTGPSNFAGEFVSFADAGAFPKPAQRPHPPIVFAGPSRGAMILASRLGNGYMAAALSPEALEARVAALNAICRADRRDPSEVETYLVAEVAIESRSERSRLPLHGDLEQIAEDVRAYEGAGLDHLIVTPRRDTPDHRDVESRLIELAGRVLIPAFGAGQKGAGR